MAILGVKMCNCIHCRREREWQQLEYMIGARDRRIDLMRPSDEEKPVDNPLIRRTVFYRAGYDRVAFRFD
ncbi:MAG: hypothetical protein KAT43_03335 [Nanoarchaeota archaeon]|nr:hypothetical protein [Nanoarchaeota archaeon]